MGTNGIWCQGKSHPKPRPKPKRPNSHPIASCLPSEECVEPTWVPTYLGSPVTMPLLCESHGVYPLGWLHSVPVAFRVSGVYSMLGPLAQLRVHLHSTCIVFSGPPPGNLNLLSTAILTNLPLESGGSLYAAEVLEFCTPWNQMPHEWHQVLPAQAVLGMNGSICGSGGIQHHSVLNLWWLP